MRILADSSHVYLMLNVKYDSAEWLHPSDLLLTGSGVDVESPKTLSTQVRTRTRTSHLRAWRSRRPAAWGPTASPPSRPGSRRDSDPAWTTRRDQEACCPPPQACRTGWRQPIRSHERSWVITHFRSWERGRYLEIQPVRKKFGGREKMLLTFYEIWRMYFILWKITNVLQ